MSEKSSRLDNDFAVANLADDLVIITLKLCGKKTEDNPRFPRATYDEFVNKILRTAMEIQESVVYSNRYEIGTKERVDYQNEAMRKCVYYNHLMRVSFDCKWISEKQRDRNVTLCSSVYWKVYNWQSSDRKRK